jgi:hypothetical protein
LKCDVLISGKGGAPNGVSHSRRSGFIIILTF